jgi:hypothetical protein
VDTRLAVVQYWNLNHHHARENTMNEHKPVDFEEIGRQAALNDEPAAPAANATVQAALAGRTVGDPENIRIMQAFSKGYQAERQAQADEEMHDMPLTGTDELTAEEHAQEFGYADPVPASDTRGCRDNGAHLASSRHTAAECPVTMDKIDRAARVDHGTTLNGPEYAWVWGEVVRKGRSVDETVAEVIDGRRDL